MEGPSCRLSAPPEGDPRPSGTRGSGGDAGSEPTWDTKTHFRVCRFIMETGVKLGMRSVPVATACVLYHRFFQRVTSRVYEPYLVAMSCLYLAGKVEEQHIRTRDVINVSHRYFNRGSVPLECDKEFWELRDSVVQCELLILRQLNFHVSFEHPHKYLLHYLLSVKSLINRHAWSRTPVAETSWALLRDCYHGDMCICHTPQHIAIAALYLALNSYGVELPAGEKEWWQVLCEDVTKADIDAVISDLLQLYDMEAKCL